MASEHGFSLGEEFATANERAVTFVRSCSDVQWQMVVPGEGWSVGVVLHHIAEGHTQMMRWLEAMARGAGVDDSAEGIDHRNVEHAARAAGASQAETVLLLLENGAALEAVLRNLSDADLHQVAPFGPAGGREMPTGALAAVASTHIDEHLDHARQAVEATPRD